MAAVLAPAPAVAQTMVAMKLRRFGDRVDLVVSGLGSNPRLINQRSSSSRWFGRLRGSSSSELAAPQDVEMPSVGLATIGLKAGADADFELSVRAMEGMALPEPLIRVDGSSLIVSFRQLPISSTALQSGRLDLSRPGRVQQPVVVPPMRARASAPPLGDIAVGSMLLNNRSYVQAPGPSVSLTLNNAPAKDALMSLARLGGYGFVYVGESDPDPDKAKPVGVTMAFREERFDRALNSVLLASGLQAKLDGRTLMVGTSVSSKTFGPQMSKVFRLNQVKVDKAADYLASLGASMNVINTITTTTGEPSSAGTSQLSNQASRINQTTTKVETYGASVGPLLGLTGTTDTRLGTVTLVGDPQLITSAENYLKQLDLRRRQVAVKVQILNVNLNNDELLDSSFSARMGDTFIVSDSGTGHLNFGQAKPGGTAGSGTYGEGVSGVPGTYENNGQVPRQSVVNPVVEQQLVAPYGGVSGEDVYVPVTDAEGEPIEAFDSDGRPRYAPDTNPTSPQVLKPVYDKKGRRIYVPDSNQYRQPDNSFYAYLEAQILARNTKILAQPTLLVQEGQKATVETGQDYVVNVDRDENGDTGTTSYTYEKENAGLTFEVNVDKIDDNGFITMNLNPSISIPIPAVQSSLSDTGGVQIYNFNRRELESGSIRLRDGQTLILTGVVSESQLEVVRKWPFLGDLPLLGSLFRKRQSTRFKDELVILVTPRVLDDDQGGVFGYGYRPATQQATELMQNAF
ncbi:type II and III secretion system protein [Synechococcus sp. HB1133]|nr:type II and III secretion system protein [Synechococcus sp. PH41509]MCB4421757.1 type II and III secretion system protein [Synechococcus sp. HB1133]MCB4430890.1 type II and III secretion system protein [Synechococcus sp. HBA1120]NHI80699.1 type II and III secretion system protein [Synechococcus sp. HB1133]